MLDETGPEKDLNGLIELSQRRGSPQKFVANLWHEFRKEREHSVKLNIESSKPPENPLWLQPVESEFTCSSCVGLIRN